MKGRKQGYPWGLGEGTVGVRGKKFIDERSVPSFSSPNGFGTFATKSTEILCQKKVKETFCGRNPGFFVAQENDGNHGNIKWKISPYSRNDNFSDWIPACAGMTGTRVYSSTSSKGQKQKKVAKTYFSL